VKKKTALTRYTRIHTVSFPPIRACIFDLDGLLINSEDITTDYTNEILKKHGRPEFIPSIRAQLMGVPNATTGDIFHNWAQLPISRQQFAQELVEVQRLHFPHCKSMPGAEVLLSNLSHAHGIASKEPVELALASSTKTRNYELKTSNPEIKQLLDVFPPDKRIVGEDPRVAKGCGKPAPDIYLAALNAINATRTLDSKNIVAAECLVFEDSIAGVEAGRRAGMRVVWVPLPEVAVEYATKEKEVLAGRTGMIDIGDEWQLGQFDDGWAETISNLESFDYAKYGIVIPS